MPHPRLGTLTKSLDVVTAASVLLVLTSAGRVAWLAGAYATAIAATLALRALAMARLRRTGVDGLPAPGAGSRPTDAPRHDRPDDRRRVHGGRDGVHGGPRRRRVARRRRARGRARAPALAAVAARGGRRPGRGGRIRAPRPPPRSPSKTPTRGRATSSWRCGIPHALEHVAAALQVGGDREVVVMTVRLHGVDTDGASPDDPTPLPAERYLFARVITLVERYGRPVRLLVVPAATVADGLATAVVRLRLVRGLRRRVRDAARRPTRHACSARRGSASRSRSRSTSGSSSITAAGAPTPTTSGRTCRRSRPATSTSFTACGGKPRGRSGPTSTTTTSSGRHSRTWKHN